MDRQTNRMDGQIELIDVMVGMDGCIDRPTEWIDRQTGYRMDGYTDR